MAEPTYQRLTRTRTRSMFAVAVASRSSLWLGSDHLLCVDSNGYTENYKRFYFRDIQTITIRATKRRIILNWILGILIALCLARCNFGSLIKPNPDVLTIVLLTVAVLFFGIPLLFNNIFGQTCACELRTAVQTEDLPSLSRVRQTRKVLGKIRPLIISSQGQLTPGEISARMQTAATMPQLFTGENLNAPPVIS